MRRFLRRAGNTVIIERIYRAVVEASRREVLYRDYGVPDTLEGRFDSLVIHAVLVLRRLRRADPPGPEMAQDLVDTIFKHFDIALREMGVGDTTVPKRMKTLAEAFLGRSAAYESAIEAGDDALAAALARNVYGGKGEGADLARYVAKSAAVMGELSLGSFIDGTATFVEPPALVTEVAACP